MENSLLDKIRSYTFAAYDMLLYLDTHPNDKTAYKMYCDLIEKKDECKNKYEEKYGPLSAFSVKYQNEFNWLKSPWPWEKEAN